MKNIMIYLSFVILLLVCLYGCTEKNQNDSSDISKIDSEQLKLNSDEDILVFDETMDEPVKVIYQRNYEYSASFETEDKSTIYSLMNALNNIEVLSESNMAVDDYDDLITFVSADGEKTTVVFEYKRLLKNNKRYNVNGYEQVNNVLLSFAGTEDDY